MERNWIKRHKRLGIFLIAALLLLAWRQYDRHFTPERWADTDISRRGKLVESLMEQYNGLEGMTRGEVEALLGTDDDEMRVRESGGDAAKIVLVYAAGRPRAMFPEYLYISLENNRVVEARITAD